MDAIGEFVELQACRMCICLHLQTNHVMPRERDLAAWYFTSSCGPARPIANQILDGTADEGADQRAPWKRRLKLRVVK